jgi:hypothetical protein
VTPDEQEAHDERMAICIEAGVTEQRAREIADEQVRVMRARAARGVPRGERGQLLVG